MSAATAQVATSACLEAFGALRTHLQAAKPELAAQVSDADIEDEFGRFRLWAANIGALSRGHSSLDYRLRDAPVVLEGASKLLSELQKELYEICLVLSGARLPYEAQVSLRAGNDDDSETSSLLSSDSELSSDGSSDSGDEKVASTELRQRVSALSNINDNLYRLSRSIRAPASHSRSLKALSHRPKDPETGVDLLEQFALVDLAFTKDLYSQLRQNARGQYETCPILDDADLVMIKRLARGVTRRRQQFLYWKKHREKLDFFAEKEISKIPKPAPTIQLQGDAGLRASLPHAPKAPTETSRPKTTLTETTATQFISPAPVHDGTQSVTSYATTARGLDGSRVEFPKLPKNIKEGKDFECPYCQMICPPHYQTARAWRTHLLRDLMPYMCTYKDCHQPDELFATKQEWLNHEQTHQKAWKCPEHASAHFLTQQDFRGHLQGEAHQSLQRMSLDDLVAICETVRTDPRTICPICFVEAGSSHGLETHLANHLERFAAFALPRDVDDGKPDIESHDGSNMSEHAIARSDQSEVSDVSYAFTGDDKRAEVKALMESISARLFKAVSHEANAIDRSAVPLSVYLDIFYNKMIKMTNLPTEILDKLNTDLQFKAVFKSIPKLILELENAPDSATDGELRERKTDLLFQIDRLDTIFQEYSGDYAIDSSHPRLGMDTVLPGQNTEGGRKQNEGDGKLAASRDSSPDSVVNRAGPRLSTMDLNRPLASDSDEEAASPVRDSSPDSIVNVESSLLSTMDLNRTQKSSPAEDAASPEVVNRTGPHDASSNGEDDKTTDPNDTVDIKRTRNTLAARKSRQKKMERFDELEAEFAKIAAERDMWKAKDLNRPSASNLAEEAASPVRDSSPDSIVNMESSLLSTMDLNKTQKSSPAEDTASPAVVNRTGPHDASSNGEYDETTDPNDTVAIKRARNTLAARKSRQKKMERFDELEAEIAKITAERDMWKAKTDKPPSENMPSNSPQFLIENLTLLSTTAQQFQQLLQDSLTDKTIASDTMAVLNLIVPRICIAIASLIAMLGKSGPDSNVAQYIEATNLHCQRLFKDASTFLDKYKRSTRSGWGSQKRYRDDRDELVAFAQRVELMLNDIQERYAKGRASRSTADEGRDNDQPILLPSTETTTLPTDNVEAGASLGRDGSPDSVVNRIGPHAASNKGEVGKSTEELPSENIPTDSAPLITTLAWLLAEAHGVQRHLQDVITREMVLSDAIVELNEIFPSICIAIMSLTTMLETIVMDSYIVPFIEITDANCQQLFKVVSTFLYTHKKSAQLGRGSQKHDRKDEEHLVAFARRVNDGLRDIYKIYASGRTLRRPRADDERDQKELLLRLSADITTFPTDNVKARGEVSGAGDHQQLQQTQQESHGDQSEARPRNARWAKIDRRLIDPEVGDDSTVVHWTKIDRRLVSPEVLDRALESYLLEGDDFVIVQRALGEEEVNAYAAATTSTRDELYSPVVPLSVPGQESNEGPSTLRSSQPDNNTENEADNARDWEDDVVLNPHTLPRASSGVPSGASLAGDDVQNPETLPQSIHSRPRSPMSSYMDSESDGSLGRLRSTRTLEEGTRGPIVTERTRRLHDMTESAAQYIQNSKAKGKSPEVESSSQTVRLSETDHVPGRIRRNVSPASQEEIDPEGDLTSPTASNQASDSFGSDSDGGGAAGRRRYPRNRPPHRKVNYNSQQTTDENAGSVQIDPAASSSPQASPQQGSGSDSLVSESNDGAAGRRRYPRNRPPHRNINRPETDQFTEAEVEKWTVAQVAMALAAVDVEQAHCDEFRRQEISGEFLLSMDQSTMFLKQFELGSVGRRLNTWKKIKALQDQIHGVMTPFGSQRVPSPQASPEQLATKSAASSNEVGGSALGLDTSTTKETTPRDEGRLIADDQRQYLNSWDDETAITEIIRKLRRPQENVITADQKRDRDDEEGNSDKPVPLSRRVSNLFRNSSRISSRDKTVTTSRQTAHSGKREEKQPNPASGTPPAPPQQPPTKSVTFNTDAETSYYYNSDMETYEAHVPNIRSRFLPRSSATAGIDPTTQKTTHADEGPPKQPSTKSGSFGFDELGRATFTMDSPDLSSNTDTETDDGYAPNKRRQNVSTSSPLYPISQRRTRTDKGGKATIPASDSPPAPPQQPLATLSTWNDGEGFVDHTTEPLQPPLPPIPLPSSVSRDKYGRPLTPSQPGDITPPPYEDAEIYFADFGEFPTDDSPQSESPDPTPTIGRERVTRSRGDSSDEAEPISSRGPDIPGTSGGDGDNKAEADSWIPLVTVDGKPSYYNTVTGEISTGLPLPESPSRISSSDAVAAVSRQYTPIYPGESLLKPGPSSPPAPPQPLSVEPSASDEKGGFNSAFLRPPSPKVQDPTNPYDNYSFSYMDDEDVLSHYGPPDEDAVSNYGPEDEEAPMPEKEKSRLKRLFSSRPWRTEKGRLEPKGKGKEGGDNGGASSRIFPS